MLQPARAVRLASASRVLRASHRLAEPSAFFSAPSARSERKKKCLVAIVSFAALLAPFSSSCFLPSIPAIDEALHTTATILDATVSIFLVVIGISPLLWAPYAGLYGRRPIYLLSLPIFTLGSMGVALSPSLGVLIVTRIIQGVGSSAVLSVGAGTIGDLYPRAVRGKAMGMFYVGVLVGPATAPGIAGVLTEYVPDGYGWRAMQWLLCGMGGAASLLVFLFLPETIHTRGVDAIREQSIVEGRIPARGSWWSRQMIVFLNPLKGVKLLYQPHILLISLNSSLVLMSTYSTLVPLSEVLAPRYNITNEAILGCFYLAQGLGNALATQVTGRHADATLRKWKEKRAGTWVPEDRLRATLISGGTALPLSVLFLGWVMDKWDGKAGLAMTVVGLFWNGIALMFVLTAANTYLVDVMQARSAEIIAVNNAVRYVFSAGAAAWSLPLIQRIGVGPANTIAAVLVWGGFGLVLVTIRWGPRLRGLGERWEGTKSGAATTGNEGRDDQEKTIGREETLRGDEGSGARKQGKDV